MVLRYTVGNISSVLVVAALFMATLMPWYVEVSQSRAIGLTTRTLWHWDKPMITTYIGQSETTVWGPDYGRNVSAVFVASQVFVIIAAVLAFVHWILWILVTTNRMRMTISRKMMMLLVTTSLVAVAAGLVSSFSFLQLQSALQLDWGELSPRCHDICTAFSGSDGDYNWGPGAGWILATLGAFVSLIASTPAAWMTYRAQAYQAL